MIASLVTILLHLSQHLSHFVESYGVWSYVILFLIVFCETGLVVAPFLPGDTLIFAAGSLAAAGALEIKVLVVLFICAALLGDNLNYLIGRTVGKRLFKNDDSTLFKKRYLMRTQGFYKKYGGKTIILARFIPIVRTFSPFVAGIAKMRYGHFIVFSFLGAVLWVGSISYLSYAFGNVPSVHRHFLYVILGIIVISLVPPAVELVRAKLKGRA